MDIREVPVTQNNKSKNKKNKKPKKESESHDGNEVEQKQVEEKMENTDAGTAFPPTFSVSEIKNKQRRHFMFMKLKQEKRKVKTNWPTT